MNGHVNVYPPFVILWGGTGQAKVARPIIEHFGAKVIAVFDDTPNLPSPFLDIPIYTGWYGFLRWLKNQPKPGDIGFCVAIGNPHGRVRINFHEQLVSVGLRPVTIAHPSAQIASNAVIGEGSQFMAGAIVNPETIIGKQCIINTKASVDHECILGDGVELAPGATLCGIVKADINVWICAGATVLPRISIGADAIVGAGAVVIQDVPAGATVVGVPATRKLYKKEY